MPTARKLKLTVIRGLNSMCVAIDAIAYRPAVVKATLWLPRWWSCQLADVSMRLDDRWGLGYWDSDEAPAASEGLCDACARRAAWLVVGGLEPEEEPGREGSYLDLHQVHLCGWCKPRFDGPPESHDDLERVLEDARDRSIGWHWK